MLGGDSRRALRRFAALLVIAVAALFVPLALNPAAADAGETTMVVVERTADGSLRVHTYTVDGTAAASISAAATSDPSIVAAEPIGTVQAFLNDPYHGNQWAHDRLDFEAAWNTTTGTGVVVAVIDTGVRATHEDLVGQVLPGADFVDGGGDGTLADHYHGSHVAGIIGAIANNGAGIAGGAPGAKILPVRVLNSNGTGSTAAVAAGIIWAVDNGADVINLSLGSSADSSVIRAAVAHAEDHEVVVVAAAGNAGHLDNPTTFPAAIEEVIAVSSTDSNDTRSYFSNHGSWVDLAGPGSSIYSLHGAGDDLYASSSGTSMATPYVAATAALIRATAPDLTALQVRTMLANTAIDLGPAGQDNEFGYGLVDPLAAVQAGLADPDGGALTPIIAEDYQVLTSFGRVIRPGSNGASAASAPLNQPVVGGTPTPSGNGHWLVAADGGIFAYGDAGYFGSTGNLTLNQPIVGMAATPTGKGYWMVAADGGIFAYGDARYHGSTGHLTLNEPIVGMAASATGDGYWLVARDGGIFTFGDATYLGSMGGVSLNEPIVGMAATPTGNGYWMVARDGGIFTFGDASYLGSTGDLALNQPVTGMAASPDGNGYWLVATDGGIFTFGEAKFGGSLAGQLQLGEVVVGMIHDEL